MTGVAAPAQAEAVSVAPCGWDEDPYERVHRPCCDDGDVALCGEDLTGAPEEAEAVAITCPVCSGLERFRCVRLFGRRVRCAAWCAP